MQKDFSSYSVFPFLNFVALSAFIAFSGANNGLAQSNAKATKTNVLKESALSPAQVKTVLSDAEQLSSRIQGMLDEARREKDIIKVTCLDDKLTRTNANLQIMKQRAQSLEKASATGDANRSNHELTVLSVLQQKTVSLEQQAKQCLGQDVFETGATKVVTDVDPETLEVAEIEASISESLFTTSLQSSTSGADVSDANSTLFIPAPASPNN